MAFEAIWVTAMSGIVTLVAALGGVYLGSHLTTSGARAQKIEDARRTAYGFILAALKRLELQMDVSDEVIAQAGEERYFYEDASRNHAAKMGEFYGEAHVRFHDDYLFLSQAFIDRFEQMQGEARAGDESPDADLAIWKKAVRSGRSDLLRVARDELK